MAAKELKLGDLCLVITKGTTPTTAGGRFTDSGVNFIKSESLAYDGSIDASKFAFIDKETHEKLKRSQIVAGDILYSIAGVNLGKCGVATADMVPANTNQAVAIIRVDPERTLSRFISYVLRDRSFVQTVLRGVAQSAQPNVNLGELARFPIPNYTIGEQRAIARILGTLDDKIELNRRMNETLEAMARALFKSWFVDTSSDALPGGWSRGKIRDLCSSIYSGGTPSTQNSAYWNGNLPWLSSGETRQKIIIETEKKITASGVENSSTRLAPALATVIASAGQGNTRGQTSLLSFDSYVNQSVVVLVANPEKSSPYHLFFDLERRYEEFRRVSDAHSSRGSLTTKLLADLDTLIPPIDRVRYFDSVASLIVGRIQVALRESRSLAALRDVLLPKLISGELRVKEAQRVLIEA